MKTLSKRFLILIFLAGYTNLQVASGQGFRMSAAVGYGLSAGERELGYTSTSSGIKNVKGSFGKGLAFTLVPGYMFSRQLGIEAGLNAVFSDEYEFISDPSGGQFAESATVKAKMFRAMPGIILSAGDTNKIEPYAHFGPVIGFGGDININRVENGQNGAVTRTFNYSQGLSIGWYGGLGLRYRISRKIKLDCGLLTICQSYAPEKLENTMNTDGSPLSDPKIFSDELTTASSDHENLKVYFPFGSIGFNIGLQVRF